MTIDIYSDIMCPWCLIGYGQLQKALAELEGEIEADIRWLPFELNPDMPPQGEEQTAHVARKYGRPPAEAQAVRDRMRAIAQEAGVSLEYAGEGEPPPAMMWNTFDAHKLLAWTLERHGADKQNALRQALFAAHFHYRRRIGERSVLLDIAEEVGLNRNQAEAVFDDETLAARMRAEQAEAIDRNIAGVPAMIVEGRLLIPGAQSPETYVNALRRVAERFSARPAASD